MSKSYDKKKLFEQAKEAVIKNKLFFIEDIVSYLPISKKTFYEYYPVDGNESNELKELLEINKIQTKISMRKKWHDSDNATLQMALMKLICNNEERKNLSVTYNHNEHSGEIKGDMKMIVLPSNSREFNIDMEVDTIEDNQNDKLDESSDSQDD